MNDNGPGQCPALQTGDQAGAQSADIEVQILAIVPPPGLLGSAQAHDLMGEKNPRAGACPGCVLQRDHGPGQEPPSEFAKTFKARRPRREEDVGQSRNARKRIVRFVPRHPLHRIAQPRSHSGASRGLPLSHDCERGLGALRPIGSISDHTTKNPVRAWAEVQGGILREMGVYAEASKAGGRLFRDLSTPPRLSQISPRCGVNGKVARGDAGASIGETIFTHGFHR